MNRTNAWQTKQLMEDNALSYVMWMIKDITCRHKGHGRHNYVTQKQFRKEKAPLPLHTLKYWNILA